MHKPKWETEVKTDKKEQKKTRASGKARKNRPEKFKTGHHEKTTTVQKTEKQADLRRKTIHAGEEGRWEQCRSSLTTTRR